MNQTTLRQPFDDPTLRAVFNVLQLAKGNLVSSRDLKEAAGARWRDAVTALISTYGMKIEVTLGASGNQSFRLMEFLPVVPVPPPQAEAVEPPAAQPATPPATQMHPGLDPLVRGPQLLTEPAPAPHPNPASIIDPATTVTLVGAMLPDMAVAWQKLHGTYPTGVVLPFSLKTSLREFTVEIRRLGLRVFFGDVTEVTFVLEGTALLNEDAGVPRHRTDALY